MNKELIDQFRVLQVYFKEQGDKGRTIAYGKVIGALQTIDKPIKSISDVQGVRGIGPKVMSKIKEFLDTGEIESVKTAKTEMSKKNKLTKEQQIINKFEKIWGIGPSKAKSLYDRGMRSMKDLRDNLTLLTTQQRIGLKYYHDLQKKIPRETITSLYVVISYYLHSILGKNNYTFVVAGSYRRGELESGDMDCLISTKKYTLPKIVRILKKHGIITDVLSMKDTKFMGIAHCPGGGLNIRLDIEYVPEESWGSALLYFTGSKTFNVHMRAQAKRRGLLLNEYGLFDIKTGKSVLDKPSEKDIFDKLGMKYIKPENR